MKIKCLFVALFACSQIPVYACTIISAAMKGVVLVGANEDYSNPFVRIWFNPATRDRYGSVCIGLPDLQPQAALNEHGLFFDYTAQEGIDPSKLALKNPYRGDILFEALGKCKNIEEVLVFLRKHDYAIPSQALIADATGRSIIVNAETIVEKTASFQVNTNFNISRLRDKSYSCWRYDLAEKELSNRSDISIDIFRKILQRTSQEGMTGTMYSTICDLKKGVMYVYLYRNFDEPYVIDLKKELDKGYRVEELASHFESKSSFDVVVANHPEFKREQIIDDISQNGVDQTLRRYESLKKGKPSMQDEINGWMIDAAIIMIVNAYNKHSSGGWWKYWYGFPASYEVWSGGENLNASRRIFEWLLAAQPKDSTPFFLHEMLGYVHTMQGNRKLGEDFYRKALAQAPKDSGTYRRSARMLEEIGK